MAEVIKENSTTKNQPWWHKAIKNFLVVVGLSAVVYAVYKLDLWVVTGLLVVIAILAIAIILLLANLGAYFFKLAQATIAFISAGKKLKKILPNVGGYRISEAEDLDGKHWLIPAKNEEERMASFFHNSLPGTVWFQKLLWETLAVRFISLFWPHTDVHCFDIRSRKRIEPRNETVPNAPLRSRVVDSLAKDGTKESTFVDSLLFLVPRPVYVEGVELAGDNSRINLLLLPVFQLVIPSLPVFYLKGDFFTLLDAAIEAVMVDLGASHRVAVDKETGQFAHDTYDPPEDAGKKAEYEAKYEPSFLTYAHWLKLTKAGEQSPLEQRLHTLNVSQGYFNELKKKADEEKKTDTEKGGDGVSTKDELLKHIEQLTHGRVADIKTGETAKEMSRGMIARFGFALISIRSVEWEAHESTKALAEALLAKETKFHEAEGVRKEADGESYAIQKRAEGESSRYERLVTALTSKGVTPDVAAEVVRTQLRTENISSKDSKVTTYVEGGASASVMVNASPSTSTK